MDILERELYPIDGNGKITVEDIVNEASGGGGGGDPVTVDTLSGATTTGKSLMKAASQEAARSAIGAGTSDFSGSYGDLSNKPTIPAAATVDNLGGAGTTGKAVMKAANEEAARTAIGAGTSNLTIGTTADTAMAGNYTPPTVTTTVNGLMLSEDKVKLNGIAENATANASDAQLRDRSTHTGSQAISTITGLQAELDDKATNAALALLEARIEALEQGGAE